MAAPRGRRFCTRTTISERSTSLSIRLTRKSFTLVCGMLDVHLGSFMRLQMDPAPVSSKLQTAVTPGLHFQTDCRAKASGGSGSLFHQPTEVESTQSSMQKKGDCSPRAMRERRGRKSHRITASGDADGISTK